VGTSSPAELGIVGDVTATRQATSRRATPVEWDEPPQPRSDDDGRGSRKSRRLSCDTATRSTEAIGPAVAGTGVGGWIPRCPHDSCVGDAPHARSASHARSFPSLMVRTSPGLPEAPLERSLLDQHALPGGTPVRMSIVAGGREAGWSPSPHPRRQVDWLPARQTARRHRWTDTGPPTEG
jgi:hypothetical protein